MNDTLLLSLLIFVAALLYSSVGHAGASGYIAAMALVGVAPDVMKPSALLLNSLVASIGTLRFYRSGCFSWQLFLPLVVGSIPLAFLGGMLNLPGTLYKQILGVVLLFAAWRLFVTPKVSGDQHRPPMIPVAVVAGGGIGLLSGLTGTGGGIFLTPLLLFMGWAETKQSAGVSVAFILVNSIAAVIGHLTRVQSLPSEIGYWAVAAVLGGVVGSGLGSQQLGNQTLRRLLALVLVIAAAKLIFV